jgi:hypothetical protein
MDTVATSPHNSDGLSDISDPFLLAPIVVTDFLTSRTRCYLLITKIGVARVIG